MDFGDPAAQGGASFILLSMLARKRSCPSLLLVIREYSGSPACWMTNLGSVMPFLPPILSWSVFQLFP